MKKQILFLSLGSIASLNALAAAPNAVFEGLYGGVMGGLVHTKAQTSVNTNTLSDTPFAGSDTDLSSSPQNVNQTKNSGIGALYLGYGKFINNSRFYMAGEVFGDFAKRNPASSTYNSLAGFTPAEYASLATNTQVKLNNGEFGVDFRPGYLVAPNTLLYGRIGAAFNKISLTTNNTYVVAGSKEGEGSYSYTSTLPVTNTKNALGLRLGLGAEHYLGNNFALTFDYIYTYYGKVTASNTGNTTGADDTGSAVITTGGFTGQSSTKVSTQAAMLGIKYYFPVNGRR